MTKKEFKGEIVLKITMQELKFWTRYENVYETFWSIEIKNVLLDIT